MNTCCFPASILICNIENGITQKWTLRHKYPFVYLSTGWWYVSEQQGVRISISSILSIASDIQWNRFYFYTLKIAFNTWSLKHSHTHILLPFAL